jgi:RPA family protein
MVEGQKNQKRQVAYKLLISSILKGEYTKGEEWNPSYILFDNKQISRVNIIATIIDKQDDVNSAYKSMIVDDGSGTIGIRTFEDNNRIGNIGVGNSVLIIGRPREFGNERYIVPEIIKKIENNDWIELRNLELTKSIKKEKPNIEVYNLEEEVIGDNPDIFTIIRQIDKGDGADFNEIAQRLNSIDAEKMINNMIKIGELFEIKPGKIKILE